MNREAIKRTAICRYSGEDDCFVTDSPLFNRAAGIGDSPQESRQHFEQMVDSLYADYVDGRLAGYERTSPGRPSKPGIIALNSRVQPETKEIIDQLSTILGDISQGEVIDYLTGTIERLLQAYHDGDQVPVGECIDSRITEFFKSSVTHDRNIAAG